MNADTANPKRLPTIVITGASGFIGRHFINAIMDDFFIHALAHKSQQDAGIPKHPNLRWVLADLGEQQNVERAFAEIAEAGGADYLLHCANYFDFTDKDHPEYTRTNVHGTRYLLENARKLRLKRLVFLSSLVVTEFRGMSGKIDERSRADATFAYARSKIEGEKLLRGCFGIAITENRCPGYHGDFAFRAR